MAWCATVDRPLHVHQDVIEAEFSDAYITDEQISCLYSLNIKNKKKHISTFSSRQIIHNMSFQSTGLIRIYVHILHKLCVWKRMIHRFKFIVLVGLCRRKIVSILVEGLFSPKQGSRRDNPSFFPLVSLCHRWTIANTRGLVWKNALLPVTPIPFL